MKIWLAPLHGITTYTFRTCLCRHFTGIDCFISPFQPAQAKAKLNVRQWRDVWPQNNDCGPLIPQLMGNEPSCFADTMSLLYETYGYTHYNWNLGCPAAQVVRHRRGCGLMPYPDRVEDVVCAATARTDLHFSIKMRLGLHNVTESFQIAERLCHYPVEFVVIHPRTGSQAYSGTPDLKSFEQLCTRLNCPVVYNGDIFTLEDFLSLQSRFPDIDNWMLGRGLLRNPFLAEEIKGMDTEDRLQRFSLYYQDFTKQLLPLRGETGTLANLKELWHYYICSIRLTPTEFQQLLRITSLSEFYEISLCYIHCEERWNGFCLQTSAEYNF